MANQPKDPSKDSERVEITLTQSSTKVDLGDDLLAAKTRMIDLALDMTEPGPQSLENRHSRPLELSEVSGQYQSAAILLREGMLEEAKRVLRRILLVDERHAPSRKLLEEIHERELKQMFASSGHTRPIRRPNARRGQDSAPVTSDDPDVVLDALDRELGLGLARQAAEPPPLSLFREFEAESPASVPGIGAQDRIDLGVAFFEMGFVELAIRQFEFACKAILVGPGGPGSEDSLIAGTGLLARAQIEGGHAFQATLNIEPLLRDMEVSHAKKLELLYLMGRACEELKQPDQAALWYGQVGQLDSEYRDVRARVQSLREKTRS